MPRPDNLFATSHWTFEIPGTTFPNFQKLEGISKTSGEISIVDGVTNIKHKFSSQIKDFGEITLTRPYDGSVDDIFMQTLEKFSFDLGGRIDGNLVKYHNGQEVFRIMFFGMRMKEVTHPSLDTSAEERYDVMYKFSVSEWEEVRT